MFLVERLESLLANGKKLPLTNNVVVDQNAALDLVDEIRHAVPEEIKVAQRINAEGDRIVEKAQEDAERILARAQEQAAFLIDDRGLTQAAEAESRRIIERAERDADEIRRGADEYAVNVLIGLEGDLVKTLGSVKKGIAMLDERRAQLTATEAASGGQPDSADGRNGQGDSPIVETDEAEGASQPARS
jgi:cell division septum initiation protein DivIVA